MQLRSQNIRPRLVAICHLPACAGACADLGTSGAAPPQPMFEVYQQALFVDNTRHHAYALLLEGSSSRGSSCWFACITVESLAGTGTRVVPLGMLRECWASCLLTYLQYFDLSARWAGLWMMGCNHHKFF